MVKERNEPLRVKQTGRGKKIMWVRDEKKKEFYRMLELQPHIGVRTYTGKRGLK